MDYIILIIVALLVGILIGWFFTQGRVREAADQQQVLHKKLQSAEAEIKRLQSKVDEAGEKIQLVYKKADQLEDINGIGPVFARRLNEAGIYTFADLTAQSPEKIREIISPKNWQAIDPEGWIAQARQL